MRRLRTLARQNLIPAEGPRAAAASTSSGDELVLRHRQVPPDDIIFGCGPLYAGEQAIVNAAVHEALVRGVVRFDTAPLYGCSEDILGAALAESSLGKAAVVYTKVGKLIRRMGFMSTASSRGPEPWAPFAVPQKERMLVPDYSAAGARLSHRESVQRMGLESCHTLRVHDPDSIEGATEAAMGPDGIVQGLCKLRAEGAITHVSLGMNANADHMIVTPGAGGVLTTPWDPSAILRLIRGVPEKTFDSALLAYGWNLFSQDAWPILVECKARGIQVHVAGIFAGLTHTNAGTVPMKISRSDRKARAQKWRDLSEKHGCSVWAVAVAFAALPAVVDKVVMGMKTKEEVENNLKAASDSSRVPPAIWAEAVATGLLGKHLPLPK